MRYAIFSDVHSNLEALRAVIEALKAESPDRYLCIGDIVGYAANPRECIEEVKAVASLSVAGNHDWATIDLTSAENFNPAARQAISWTRRYLDADNRQFLESLQLIYKNDDLTLVHGTLDNPQDFNYMLDEYNAARTFNLLETGICFIGHTHIPAVFMKDKSGEISYSEDAVININENNSYIINVGSVGQPRDGNPDACFCIYDSGLKSVNIKRIKYDFQSARNKIIEAGLPKYLGDRLLAGR